MPIRREHILNTVIETNGIVKRYGAKLAVNNVSIHVERGDIYGLIGKNGAGKTTLMKMLLGLTFPTSGSMRLFGSEDLNTARARIGSLIEAPGLYTGESAYENMKRFGILFGATEDDIRRLLALVGLSDVGGKKVGSFSLGMKQRLGIAIALLADPELLVLDEPINGLDPAGIKDVRDIILELSKKGVTVLISSHLLDELGKIANKFGIMRDGALVEELTKEEIHELCRTPLDIRVSDPNGARAFIEANFNGIGINQIGDTLHLYSDFINPAVLNKKLVEAGYDVYELKRENIVLEDFFIRRMG